MRPPRRPRGPGSLSLPFLQPFCALPKERPSRRTGEGSVGCHRVLGCSECAEQYPTKAQQTLPGHLSAPHHPGQSPSGSVRVGALIDGAVPLGFTAQKPSQRDEVLAQSQLATNHSASLQSGALGVCRKSDTLGPEEGRAPERMGRLNPSESRGGTWSQDAGMSGLPLSTTERNSKAWDRGADEGQGKGEGGL